MTTSSRSRWTWKPVVVALGLVVLVSVAVFGWRTYQGRREAGTATTVQEVTAGNMRIFLLSPTGSLSQGRNVYTIEFRSADGTLMDVGVVRASANMPMPGMVMSGGVQLRRTPIAGRYEATAEFGMAGAWQMALEWDGPAGQGSANFEGMVQ